jgi:hypothetical protein
MLQQDLRQIDPRLQEYGSTHSIPFDRDHPIATVKLEGDHVVLQYFNTYDEARAWIGTGTGLIDLHRLRPIQVVSGK